MNLRPMLAQKIKFEQLKSLTYPVVIQPKYDGVRCLLHDNVALSRTLKLLPNKIIQATLSGVNELFDGEIIYGKPTDNLVCSNTVSYAMTEEVTGLFCNDWRYYVFDVYQNDVSYQERRKYLVKLFDHRVFENIELVPERLVHSPDEIMQKYAELVSCGYEGCILRSLHGKYKYGRSTLKEQYLLKLKPYEDAEASIVDCVPLSHNMNEAVRDERGYTKRSTHKEFKVTSSKLLGAFVCRTNEGVEFNIGTGFTELQRKDFWSDRLSLIGKQLTYTYLNTGCKNKPRNPVFKCFRPEPV